MTLVQNPCGAVQPLREGGPTFAELKHDLFFTERRLMLLLETMFHPEIIQWVNEKMFVRSKCKEECTGCISRLEASVNGKMRGIWNEVKIVQAFDVEVDLRFLVGCEWYERSLHGATREVTQLISRIRELGSLIVGNEENTPEIEKVNSLLRRFEAVDWSCHDIARLSEALKAKEKLLLEVSELTRSLQEIGWSCSIHEAKKEEARRKAKTAQEEGEIELAAQFTQEETDVSEALMQLLLFKLQTTESSQAENTLKRRNNVSQWKLAAAQLETLKEQKIIRQHECIRDNGRIKRGLAYELGKHEVSREDFKRRKKQYDDKLSYLNEKQDRLMSELSELCNQFKQVEVELSSIATERVEAVQASVEIVEAEAQRVADYQEFVRYANEHSSYVEATSNMAEEGSCVINSLQRFLMNEQDYDEHDFYQTTRGLNVTKLKTLKQLNICYTDYCAGVMKVVRQYDSKIRQLDEEVTRQQLLAECSRETLNPEAKRFVTSARQHLQERDELSLIRNGIVRKIIFMRDNYFKKVKEDLPSHEVVEPDDDIAFELLHKRDELLTMREELLYPIHNHILDEREDINLLSGKFKEELEEGTNRQVKKGEGLAAMRLRKQVGKNRDTDSSADDEAGLQEKAMKQHEEVLAAETDAQIVRERMKEKTKERKETRHVAAAFDGTLEREATKSREEHQMTNQTPLPAIEKLDSISKVPRTIRPTVSSFPSVDID